MAAQALYRRWRPQTFADVYGQEHVTQTLQNAVATDRLAHAYLFTGVRGTGKTSVARILAKAVNCTGEGVKPCNACAMCRSITEGRALDLIEIDAASNTGVDDVRDLRDKIGFSPNEARFKVYIIDEVHMLSNAAFNALLKTLEEPPPHAFFILATTEPHKIPDTIASRCQRHDFRRVSVEVLATKLARICAAEGITAEPDALKLIARHATGSLRDGESLLDQLMSTGEAITVGFAQVMLGTSGNAVVSGLVEAILNADAATGLRHINEALDHGADPRQLQNEILDYLRGLLLLQTGIDAELLDMPDDQLAHMRTQAGRLPAAALVAALHRFNDARPSADRTQPSLPLELALVESVMAGLAPSPPPQAAPQLSAATAQINAATPVKAPAAPAKLPGSHTASPAARADAPKPRSDAQVAPADVVSGLPAASTDVDTDIATDVHARPTDIAKPPALAASPTTVAAPFADLAASPTDITAPAADFPGPTTAATPPADVAATPRSNAETIERVLAHWSGVVAEVGAQDKNIAALLKDCRPIHADGGKITLGFYYDFHRGRVADPARAAVVAAAIGRVLGGPVDIECTLVPPSADESTARPRNKTDQAKTDPVVRHALENMGARIGGVQAVDPEETS